MDKSQFKELLQKQIKKAILEQESAEDIEIKKLLAKMATGNPRRACTYAKKTGLLDQLEIDCEDYPDEGEWILERPGVDWNEKFVIEGPETNPEFGPLEEAKIFESYEEAEVFKSKMDLKVFIGDKSEFEDRERGGEKEEEEGMDPVPLFKGKDSLYQQLFTVLVRELGIQRADSKSRNHLAAVIESILKDLSDQLGFNQIPVSEEKRVTPWSLQKGVLQVGKAAGSRLKGAFGGNAFNQKTITDIIVKILKPFIAKALEDRDIENIQIKEDKKNYIDLTIEENV